MYLHIYTYIHVYMCRYLIWMMYMYVVHICTIHADEYTDAHHLHHTNIFTAVSPFRQHPSRQIAHTHTHADTHKRTTHHLHSAPALSPAFSAPNRPVPCPQATNKKRHTRLELLCAPPALAVVCSKVESPSLLLLLLLSCLCVCVYVCVRVCACACVFECVCQ